jgi:hypothetical protein
VTAQLGANDLDDITPDPKLLAEVTGIEPEASGMHVLLDAHGVRSIQRIALDDAGGGAVVALWPGELKSQARYLYDVGRGEAVVAAAREHGWRAAARPHIGFFNY